MRPVDRGPKPAGYDEDTTDYKDAQGFLVERLGPYCSYCERRIAFGIHIEHVLPKSRNADLETKWTNFLLACGNCNWPKSNRNWVWLKDKNGDKWVEKDDQQGEFLLWPNKLHGANTDHKTDTFNFYRYKALGIIEIHPETAKDHQLNDRVLATLAMVNLDTFIGQSSDIENLWFSTVKPKEKKSRRNAVGYINTAISGEPPDNTIMVKGAKNAQMPKSFTVVARTRPANMDFFTASKTDKDIKDHRALQRAEAWELATRLRRKFDRLLPGNVDMASTEFKDRRKARGKSETDPSYYQTKVEGEDLKKRIGQMTRLVLRQAQAAGFWSVWVTVFKKQPDDGPARDKAFNKQPAIVPVLEGLVGDFPGTTQKTFRGTRPKTDFYPPLWSVTDETEWGDLIGEKTAKDTELADAKKKADEEKAKVEKDLEDCNKKSADLEEQKKQLEEQKKQLEEQKKQLEEQKEQLEARVQELEEQKKQLEEQKKQLEEQRRLLEERQRELEEENADLRKQLEDCKQARMKLAEEKTNLLHQTKQLTAQNQQLTAQNQQLTAQNQQLTAQNQQLTVQNQQLAQQVAALQPPPPQEGMPRKRIHADITDEDENQGEDKVPDPNNKRQKREPPEGGGGGDSGVTG